MLITQHPSSQGKKVSGYQKGRLEQPKNSTSLAFMLWISSVRTFLGCALMCFWKIIIYSGFSLVEWDYSYFYEHENQINFSHNSCSPFCYGELWCNVAKTHPEAQKGHSWCFHSAASTGFVLWGGMGSTKTGWAHGTQFAWEEQIKSTLKRDSLICLC